jgi:hypothetical protein
MKKKKPLTKPAAAAKPAAPPKAAAAFEQIRPEIEALADDDLMPINLDIPQAVSLALGALPALRSLRAEIVEKLPQHPIGHLDRLERYALAVWYAHLLAQPDTTADERVRELVAEAAPLRENLLGDAEALARRRLLDAGTVAEIRAGQGLVDTANDLVALAALFDANWDDVEDKTAATEAEVTRAAELGPLLLRAVALREHGPVPPPADAASARARAFTLFVRAYDECRRAVSYVRWHDGDEDDFAPSLYKKRAGRGAAGAAQPAETTTPAGGTPSGSSGAPGGGNA